MPLGRKDRGRSHLQLDDRSIYPRVRPRDKGHSSRQAEHANIHTLSGLTRGCTCVLYCFCDGFCCYVQKELYITSSPSAINPLPASRTENHSSPPQPPSSRATPLTSSREPMSRPSPSPATSLTPVSLPSNHPHLPDPAPAESHAQNLAGRGRQLA